MAFKNLLRFRQVWLGVALLWVILFHSPFDLGPFDYFKSIGYGGVDICFFASGIGCFYSLSKESDVVCFMKRRFNRLIPTYLVFIVFWLIFKYIEGTFQAQMALGNLLAIQNFTGHGHDFNWYISAILLFYLFAPYFKIIAEKASPLRKTLFLLFLIVCSIPFWNADTYIITVTRLPIFFLGMVFADICQKDTQIARHHIIGMIIMFLLGLFALVVSAVLARPYLWSHGLFWYPFILITPPLCLFISYISIIFEKSKITRLIVSFFSLCGDYSFELYLLHILLISCVSLLIQKNELYQYGPLIWLASGVALFIGCYLLRQITKHLTLLVSRRQTKFNG